MTTLVVNVIARIPALYDLTIYSRGAQWDNSLKPFLLSWNPSAARDKAAGSPRRTRWVCQTLRTEALSEMPRAQWRRQREAGKTWESSSLISDTFKWCSHGPGEQSLRPGWLANGTPAHEGSAPVRIFSLSASLFRAERPPLIFNFNPILPLTIALHADCPVATPWESPIDTHVTAWRAAVFFTRTPLLTTLTPWHYVWPPACPESGSTRLKLSNKHDDNDRHLYKPLVIYHLVLKLHASVTVVTNFHLITWISPFYSQIFKSLLQAELPVSMLCTYREVAYHIGWEVDLSRNKNSLIFSAIWLTLNIFIHTIKLFNWRLRGWKTH